MHTGEVSYRKSEMQLTPSTLWELASRPRTDGPFSVHCEDLGLARSRNL